MRVLGVDPGTAILGWGIVEREGARQRALAYGAVTTSDRRPMAERLRSIYQQLSDVVAQHAPDAAAVEKLFFGQNSRTALAVGQARGVVLLVFAQASLPYVEMTPAEVKQALTGYGRAEKQQMQKMVQRLLGLDQYPKPDDVADALAIALCGEEILRRQQVWGL
jgi:crossover junction endodeoxyribonuclease RuvC